MLEAFLVGAMLLACGPSRAETQGHSHNDYAQSRPLQTALEHGFGSIEADVYPINGELLVGHNPADLKPEKTLRSIYLDPLRGWYRAGEAGKAKPGSLQLMIDIKRDATNCYRLLLEQLISYPDLIATLDQGTLRGGPVRVVLSGDRPFAEVARDLAKWTGLDGKLEHLANGKPTFATLEMPMISAQWTEVCHWNGVQPILGSDETKLTEFIELCHRNGRTARLWGAPDRLEVWLELKSLGMDWVNTDFLAEAGKALGLKPSNAAGKDPQSRERRAE